MSLLVPRANGSRRFMVSAAISICMAEGTQCCGSVCLIVLNADVHFSQVVWLVQLT